MLLCSMLSTGGSAGTAELTAYTSRETNDFRGGRWDEKHGRPHLGLEIHILIMNSRIQF